MLFILWEFQKSVLFSFNNAAEAERLAKFSQIGMRAKIALSGFGTRTLNQNG